MLRRFTKFAALAAMVVAVPVTANSAEARPSASQARELPPYLQCVPYAREQSGIQIYGDAHTWWGQAKGKFKRGSRPKVGAVMAFQPHRNMRLGHVAAVSKIIDKRTVLLRHSNWSPINGRRGQIENDVRAIDVSRNNDWSQVRVWYAPSNGLGKTAWPIHGFIYSDKAPKFETPSFRAPQPKMQITRAQQRPQVLAPKPVTRAPSRLFTNAFADMSVTPRAQTPRKHTTQMSTPKRTVSYSRPQAPSKSRGSVDQRVKSAISLYE